MTRTAGQTCDFDDLVILEPVVDLGAPVPVGTTGARPWVTVLFSRTLPLIRYELSDQVTLAGRGCPCGRPFGLLADALRILLVTSGTPIDEVSVRRSVEDAMRTSGIPQIRVGTELADSIPRTALGKTPLVRRAPH